MVIDRVLGLLLLGPLLQAQHVLYNEKQDKTAQEAVARAKDITNDALFDKMLANLDVQSKQEVSTTLAYTREQMRSKLASFSTWNSRKDTRDTVKDGIRIHDARCYSPVCYVDVIENRLQDSPSFSDPVADEKAAEGRVQQIKVKVGDLDKAVQQLKDSAKTEDPDLSELTAHLRDANDSVAYAKQLSSQTNNKGLGNALNEIDGGLDEMIALYQSAQSIWRGYQAVKRDPTSLAPRPELIQLQLLKLEQEHIAELSRIRANMRLEVGEALENVRQARAFLTDAQVWNSNDRIEDTLRSVAGEHPDPARLRLLLDGLFQCTAVLAVEDAPVRLASNRESDEQRRYSIRQSAVTSSTYNQTIQSAVQRLALYYKSGLKPSDIAQLIFFLTNSVSVPVIATK